MKIAIQSKSRRGFTLLEIVIVVTIIGLLAAIAIPNLIYARQSSRLTTIRSNLRQIESAKDQWAIENHKTNGAPVPDITVLEDYIRGGDLKVVIHETYQPNAVGTPAEALLPPGVSLGEYTAGGAIPAP